MARIQDVALPLASICTPVPPNGDGICERCRGGRNQGWTRCWSCERVESQLSRSCELVVPISLYQLDSQLHYQLRNYKIAHAVASQDFLVKTAALLGYFLQLHGSCIATAAGGRWDIITSVPSTANRSGVHPLVSAINMVRSLRERYEPLLTRGGVEVTHLEASDEGFMPSGNVQRKRVLLIDDTFTSGARAQSAASALNRAGAHVVAIVPIGRVITPDFSDRAKEYWGRQERQLFDFNSCCVGAHGIAV